MYELCEEELRVDEVKSITSLLSSELRKLEMSSCRAVSQEWPVRNPCWPLKNSFFDSKKLRICLARIFSKSFATGGKAVISLKRRSYLFSCKVEL